MAPDPHHVGIDLAWGEKRPTGLAALDADGRLCHVSTVVTDDEIVDALAPYTAGPCLVAIDAPLVVKNPTGSRPAEQELSRDFRRFEAGAHPANTGKPEFRDTPRGARVAKLLGLDIDPRSGRARRAVEVYPHPATVVLFGLEKTLKYKDKPGRTIASLQAALLALMTHLEGLAVADPPLLLGEEWAALRTRAERATRKSELRVVEDQVDAVVCAYVAAYADRHPARMRLYGDLDQGYILTPALPGEDAPEPAEDPVRAAVREYAARQPALADTAQRAVALMTQLLDEAGINYLNVSGRAKSVASFAGKAARQADGRPMYADPLREITDQVGVRVITYVRSDVDAVADLLASQVRVHDDRDLGEETASQGRFGYASRHLLVSLDPERPLAAEQPQLVGQRVQVQIRTVLQHAWAEFEHDIRYKGSVPEEHAGEFDRRFTLAAGLLELADREFSMIWERLRPAAAAPADAEDDDPRLDPRELAAFLAGQYADAGWSRTDHYGWISGLLLELGITSLDELGSVLRAVDSAAINDRMDYRYPPGAVRRLDDALLAAYGEEYVALHGNAHRRALLATRLQRIRG
ncbi:DUF429 domain-containing protein [Nocardioides ferulae]|uniref:DUF429 domain-containing protein n=1 Tax=Nocardioides ferulae TaxID=2340821 RepID=UPI000EB5A7BF|nr:DUF429 domain-containing protein [Nocardioides ferulae]